MNHDVRTYQDDAPNPAAAMAVAALAGLAIGYLFFTEHGRRVRGRVEPMLRTWADEMAHLSAAAERVRTVYQQGRDSLAAASRVTHAPRID